MKLYVLYFILIVLTACYLFFIPEYIKKTKEICGLYNLNRIELWEKVRKKRGEKIASEIFPTTYILPRDYEKAKKEGGNIMILKNRWGSLRIGLKVIEKKDLEKYKNKYDMVQNYIVNPLTINGYKVSSRFFIVAYCGEGIFLYKNGYNYYANNKYQVNKVDPKGQIVPVNNDTEHLIKNNLLKTTNEIRGIKKIVERLSEKVKIIVNSCDKLCCPHDKGKFNIYGMDVDLKDNMDPMVIEINSRPTIYTKSNYKNEIINKLKMNIKEKNFSDERLWIQIK